MTRASPTCILFAAGLLGTGPGVCAQTVGSPVLPRGSLFFRMNPSATNLSGLYGSDGSVPLGTPFSGHPVGSATLEGLLPAAERFGDLAGSAGTPGLTLGRSRARFSADEKIVPLQLSYGILDRLTVGVTVPFIRKRLDSFLRLAPEEADVGRNPTATNGGEVFAFLTEADAAVATAQTAVDDLCLASGEQDPNCIGGRSFLNDVGAFLTDLDSAYQEELVFPLPGSELGDGIRGRWDALADGFEGWGATGPESAVPLASTAVDQGAFESLAVDPAWPGGGFPTDRQEVFMGLGDIELHAAVGLLDAGSPTPAEGQPRGLRLSAAVMGSVRFGTGEPDSLRTASPVDPPRGVSGFTLGVVADLSVSERFAALAELEAGWNGNREMTLIAPDPAGLFDPSLTRTDVDWKPGGHIRASMTPRVKFGSRLSLGVGWHLIRREPDTFDPIEAEGAQSAPVVPFSDETFTQHALAVELRYVAMDDALDGLVPFPFEVLLRGLRTVSGSEGAPEGSRAEAMVRFRLWDRN